MDYFKVLPTDERYRNLNFCQKSVLVYQIEKSKKQEYELYQSILDSLKMYINPTLYKKEIEARGGTSSSYQKVNSEFEQQSRSARLYGKPELSPEMKQALDSFRDLEKNPDAQKVDVGAIDLSDINDDEVLG